MKTRGLFCVFVIYYLFFANCNRFDKNKPTVDFSETNQFVNSIDTNNKNKLYIAISSMVSPKETFSYYNDLVQYVSEKFGGRAILKQKKTYREVNDLLAKSEVDFAFICSGAYINDAKAMKLIAVPVIDGQTYYRAYIITNKESGINSFKEFKDKTFAFTDPISNTGKLYPSKKAADISGNYEAFFSETLFTYGHDIALQMVNRNIIDGASVNSLIYDYIEEYHPERVSNIKIIEKSELFGIPPIVASKNIDLNTFNRIKNIFLNLHNDSVGKSIINKIHIEKFVTANDGLYNSVRDLKDIEKHE